MSLDGISNNFTPDLDKLDPLKDEIYIYEGAMEEPENEKINIIDLKKIDPTTQQEKIAFGINKGVLAIFSKTEEGRTNIKTFPKLADKIQNAKELNLHGKDNTSTLKIPTPSSSESTALPKTKAVLYMSITGNPPHLGHMGAVATAIKVLASQNIKIDRVLVSLSNEGYLKRKVLHSDIQDLALSQEAREFLLDGAIKEAERRKMFDDVKVEYWDDQDQVGESDHSESYQRLAKTTDDPVYLVAGMDLCVGTDNWSSHSIDNAVVVYRSASDEKLKPVTNNLTRIFAKTFYPEFESLSSTLIHKGQAKLEPSYLQDYFEQQKSLSTANKSEIGKKISQIFSNIVTQETFGKEVIVWMAKNYPNLEAMIEFENKRNDRRYGMDDDGNFSPTSDITWTEDEINYLSENATIVTDCFKDAYLNRANIPDPINKTVEEIYKELKKSLIT